jgi:hypothetical protein
MRKQPAKVKGIFEKTPGSDVWSIRYADATGRIRREKAKIASIHAALMQVYFCTLPHHNAPKNKTN